MKRYEIVKTEDKYFLNGKLVSRKELKKQIGFFPFELCGEQKKIVIYKDEPIEDSHHKSLILVMILALFSIVLGVSCSSTKPVQTISPEILEKQKGMMGYEKGYKKGYEDALNECTEKVIKEVEKIKGAILYRELKGKGLIEDPVVIPVFIRGKTEDGKLVSPRIEWRIVKPARFVDYTRARETIFSKRVFVYLRETKNYLDAKRWVDENLTLLDDNDKVRYIKIEGGEGVAIIVETSPQLADDYAKMYAGAYTIY